MSSGTFLAVDDPRWQTFLEGLSHDIYHSAGYSRCTWAEGATNVMAYAWESDGVRAFIPLGATACPPEVCCAGEMRYDACSPYGYGGPLISNPGSKEGQVIGDLIEDCKSLGIATVFLRISQLVATGFSGQGFPESTACHQLGTTYGISLDGCSSEQDLLNKYRDNHRRVVRKMLGATAFEVRFDEWQDIDSFIALYNDDMKRLGAASSYYFPRSYFLSLKEQLQGHVHLLTVLRAGECIGGVMFFFYRNLIHYHLTGCSAEERSGGLSKYMIHLVAEWGRAHGAAVMHLGGGLGGREDSLAHFKRGFADLAFPFMGCDIIVDESWYAQAVARAGVDSAHSGFFPSYRTPR
jgi:hypothetical protein